MMWQDDSDLHERLAQRWPGFSSRTVLRLRNEMSGLSPTDIAAKLPGLDQAHGPGVRVSLGLKQTRPGDCQTCDEAAGAAAQAHTTTNPLISQPTGWQQAAVGESDRDRSCSDIYWHVDTPTCNRVTQWSGPASGAICHASASERLGQCVRGLPMQALEVPVRG